MQKDFGLLVFIKTCKTNQQTNKRGRVYLGHHRVMRINLNENQYKHIKKYRKRSQILTMSEAVFPPGISLVTSTDARTSLGNLTGHPCNTFPVSPSRTHTKLLIDKGTRCSSNANNEDYPHCLMHYNQFCRRSAPYRPKKRTPT